MLEPCPSLASIRAKRPQHWPCPSQICPELLRHPTRRCPKPIMIESRPPMVCLIGNVPPLRSVKLPKGDCTACRSIPDIQVYIHVYTHTSRSRKLCRAELPSPQIQQQRRRRRPSPARRLVLGERSNLPANCGKVARHTPRKVSPGEPSELRNRPQFSQICRSVAPGAEIWPKFRPKWPTLGNIGKYWPIVGELRPKLVRFGQSWRV